MIKTMKRITAGILALAMLAAGTGCSVHIEGAQITDADRTVPVKGAQFTDVCGSGDDGASEEAVKVSYLGPEGTYTQEACGVFFKNKGSYIPYETVKDAVDALVKGESSFAVIPQENTIGGAVTDYLDIVIGQDEVSIAGEVELLINQNLLALPGTELKDIEKVYSHKQGIAQGKEWFEENLPDVQMIEVSSTAEGARIVAKEGDKTLAAIASAACAEVYGLDMIAAGIQNNDNNKTRFYVLSLNEPSRNKYERMVFTASGKAEDLPKLMEDIKKRGMTLVTIHDRPKKTELGQYNYLIECSNADYESYEKLTEENNFEFRYLGSFEVCPDAEAGAF